MRATRLILAFAALCRPLSLSLAPPLAAQTPPGYDQLATDQAAANAKAGARHAPAHVEAVA